MAVLDDRELSLLRENWRDRFATLTREDRTKVACLLGMALPGGLEKNGAVMEWLGELGGRLARPVSEFLAGAPAVARATAPAVAEAAAPVAGGAYRGLVDALGRTIPSTVPRAVGEVAAGTAARATPAVAPGLMGRIIQSWQESGVPGRWLSRLGPTGTALAKAQKYMIFPGGPLLTGWQAAHGHLGPISTLGGMAGLGLALPFGMPGMAADMAFNYLVAPKIDEAMGWKPVEQREYEAYMSGGRQGADQAMAQAGATPPVGPPPSAGAFYQPTNAYTSLGAMETEQAGRILRGEA